MLEGQHTNDDISDITSKFINNCKRMTDLDSLPLQVTDQEFKKRMTG